MSTYRTLKGYSIKKVDGNPSNTKEGQIWYNDTSNKIKGRLTIAAAFSSGGNLPANKNDGAGAGTLTAGLQFGSSRVPDSPNSGGLSTHDSTFEYDGSSWTAGGDMNTGRTTFGGTGTQTAALAFGGRITNNPFTYTANSEEYNGSSWTEGNNLGATMYYMNRTGVGTQTAGLAAGGILIPGGASAKTQEYDGSSWSEVNAAPTNLSRVAGAGTQTAAIFTGNQTGSPTVYLYDGTNWTVSPATSSTGNSRTFTGTQTAGLAVGGGSGSTASELWNGTTFSADAVLSTARQAHMASTNATQAANYVCGGNNPGTKLNSTEEYTGVADESRGFDVS